MSPGGPFLAGPSARLLRTIAEGLDIRRVFPRVSEICEAVLLDDALDLVFRDCGGDVTLEARSTDELTGHAVFTGADDEAFSIVSDLRGRAAGAERRPARGRRRPARRGISSSSMSAASRAARS